MTNDFRALNDDERSAVCGGKISQVNNPWYHGPTLSRSGGVGQGDTIDTDMTANGNLPGAGNWGN